MRFGSFNDMPQLQRTDSQEVDEKKARVDFALKNFTNSLFKRWTSLKILSLIILPQQPRYQWYWP
jgi:hypothetical protein